MKRKDYDDVMGAIDEMVARRRAAKASAATGNLDLVAKYAKEYFNDVQELMASGMNSSDLLANSFYSFKAKIQSLDPNANVTSLWSTSDDGVLEALNHVKIVWSAVYSKLNNVDREITIDQFDIILKEALE